MADCAFRDNEGREWTVLIDGYVLSCARAGGVKLDDVFRGQIDPVVFLDLCYYGVQHSARMRAAPLSREEFLRGLRGRALNDAIRATANALAECLALPQQKQEQERPTDGAAAAAAPSS